MREKVLQLAAAELPATIALRRRLHAIPELGLHLPKTQEAILGALRPLGLEVSTGSRLSSITAVLRGGKPGPSVILRADMDGLPLTERTGLPFASTHEGLMHACGHDAHMAMLVSAARVLSGLRAMVSGEVVLLFQPGEEGHGGARLVLEEGLLAHRTEPRAYALHTTPSLPPGHLGLREGTLFAAAETVRVTFRGPGGHGAMPHRTADPMMAASAFCLNVQAVLSRVNDPFDPVVFSAGRISGGSAPSVLPLEVTVEGTLRAVTTAGRATARGALRRVAGAVAQMYGVEVAYEQTAVYEPARNDGGAIERVRSLARGLFPTAELPTPVMAAEDFGEILARVPGAMILLGTRASGEAAPNHSPRLDVHEPSLSTGTALLVLLGLGSAALGA